MLDQKLPPKPLSVDILSALGRFFAGFTAVSRYNPCQAVIESEQ